MKKLLRLALFLPMYVFLFFESDFIHINFYASLFFYLNVFLAVFLVAEGFLRLFKTNHDKRTNIRLLLAAIFFSILLLEIILRFGLALHVNYMEANRGFYLSQYANNMESWYHVRFPGLGYSESKKEFLFDYKVNSEGFVDRKHSKTKVPGEFRIITLGDSFTEGAGAAQNASWPAQLEQSLNGMEDKRKFSVIKAGISGSDPFFEYVLLRDRLIEYGPDLVVVALNESDIHDYLVRGGMERFQANGGVVYRKGPSWEWLYALSYIYRVVVHEILGYDRNLRKGSDWKKNMMEAKAQIHSCLKAFNKLARREGFQLLLVFHPIAWEVANGKMIFTDLAKKLRNEPGIEVLDLLTYYVKEEHISQTNVRRYYWKIDRHHNAAGYAAFARGVIWKLRQMGITH